MPIISADGESLSYGRGGGVAYVNGQAVGPGCIGPFPFTANDRNCGQQCTDACALVSTAPGLPVLQGDGVSWPMAGGGRWMYQGTLERFYDSARGQVNGLYPLGVDEQGFGATYVYQAGSTVEITWPNGSSRALINTGVANQRGSNFRNGVLCFNETGQGWSLYGVNGAPWSPDYKRNPAATQCVVVWIDGTAAPWVFEQNNTTVVTLRRIDQTTAYIVSQGVLAFNQDCRQRRSGDIRMAWANNEGEPFGSVTDISLTLAQVFALPSLDITAPPVPPVEPPQPPQTTNDLYLPLPLAPLPPARVGCTDGPDARPGNAEWSPSPADASLNRPVGEGAPYEATMVGREWLCVKYSTEKAAAGTLDQSIALAKRLHRPLEIHHDDVHDPAQIQAAIDAADKARAAGVVPILQAHAVENVADFEHQARSFYAKDRRFNICVNFRVAGKDPDKFRAVIQKAEQLHRELRPVCVWFVHHAAAGPLMKAYVAEYCRLTPTP
jgi:hypothetical protein